MTKQYENPKLWTLESVPPEKRYVSVPAEVPKTWEREHRKNSIVDIMIYRASEYEIRGRNYGEHGRTYTVYRLDMELPLAFYSRLKDAKERAIKNARGEDRINVA